MSTLGLAGLALVVVAAAAVLVLALRRRVIIARRPRTVADLVRLQDGTPAGGAGATAAGPGQGAAEGAGSSTSSDGVGAPEPDQSLAPELDETGVDTPWRRAARMAGTPLDPAPAVAAPSRFRANGSRPADRVPEPPRRIASGPAADGSGSRSGRASRTTSRGGSALLVTVATRPDPAPITTDDGSPPTPAPPGRPAGMEPAAPGLVPHVPEQPRPGSAAADRLPEAAAEPAASVESEEPRGLDPSLEAAAEPSPDDDSGSEDGSASALDLPADPTASAVADASSSTGADLTPCGAPVPQPVTAALDDPPPEIGSNGSRLRRTPDEHAAEQASVDIALLRTFGFADPSAAPASPPVVSLTGVDGSSPEPAPRGAPQPVRAHALGRDGAPVPGVAVTLLDGRGREAASGSPRHDGGIELAAPQPGSYVLVAAAPGHQAGAVAVAVADEPAEVELLLVRSASVCGAVRGQHGLLAGARVALVQDGEVVDTAESGRDGAYRIGDLAAGGYGLSIAAAGCAPIATLLSVPEGTDVRYDVDLDPAADQASELASEPSTQRVAQRRPSVSEGMR